MCDMPKAAIGKHSCQAVRSHEEVGHCQHRSHASVGECSREAVDHDCDLTKRTETFWNRKCSHEAVPSNIEVVHGQHRSHASVEGCSRETIG
eukprot:5059379-Amphidinium_carterae.1